MVGVGVRLNKSMIAIIDVLCAFVFFYVLSYVVEVFSEVEHGIDVDPSILYYLFGGGCLIWVPSTKVIDLICSCSMV